MSIRSWDVFLGGPFNIAQYALLTMMLAQVANLEPGELIISSGDTHLYLNHLEQARMQLERESIHIRQSKQIFPYDRNKKRYTASKDSSFYPSVKKD